MKKPFISINAKKECGKVSETLYGLFLEDINFSCDGGLNANMVRNYSFDEVYLAKQNINDLDFVMGKIKPDKRLETERDHLRYWNCNGGKFSAGNIDPVSENSFYASIKINGNASLENWGYNGQHSNECAMSIQKGDHYTLSLFIRGIDFNGKVTACVQDNAGKFLTNCTEIPVTAKWEKASCILDGNTNAYGKLVLLFEGRGDVNIDAVRLYNNDYWGKDNPKWSQGLLRRDMVESLRDLHPKFMRFPGGCIVEGLDIGNEYHWKDSVGQLIDRKSNYNLWSYHEEDFGYSQSYQIGFYEFFLLCEDLKMEPLPIVWAGMNCQMRKRGSIVMDSDEFQQDVIQNALDLIEFANGNPDVNPWAKLRAEAGHPEPFNLKYVGIGNENYGEDYLKRFRAVKQKIDEKYPGIICILSGGPSPSGKNLKYAWSETKKGLSDVYVDEHFYKKPSWVIKQAGRYDKYSRDGAKVFLGEWAAYDMIKGSQSEKFITNTYETALAEAAFLTGIERNADIVSMTCYAPLFSIVGSGHWRHNLIWFNPAEVMKTANYYVQKIFSTTVGKKILSVNARLPKGVFACATSDEEYICLKVVNTTQRDYTINLMLTDFEAIHVKQTILHASGMKEKNELKFHGAAVENVRPSTVDDRSFGKEDSIIIKGYSVNLYQMYNKGDR